MVDKSDFIIKTKPNGAQYKCYALYCDKCSDFMGKIQILKSSKSLCKKCRPKKDVRYLSGPKSWNWNGGIKKPVKCLDCDSMTNSGYNKRCTPCSGKSKSGSNNPNYKGDTSKTKISELIRADHRYKDFVKSVMKRDNYTCQYTGSIGGELEVHHSPLELHEIIDEARRGLLSKIDIINYVLDLHKNLSLGITVSKKYHKQVIHKDSYNFKYKERQPAGSQAIGVIALNVSTNEQVAFSSMSKASKYTKVGMGSIRKFLIGLQIWRTKNWIFASNLEDLLKNSQKIEKDKENYVVNTFRGE